MKNRYLLAHKDQDVALISIILNQNGFSHKIVADYLDMPLFGDNFFVFKKNFIDWYCEKKMWNRFVEAIFKKIKEDRDFSQKIVKKSYQIGGKLKIACYEVLNNEDKIIRYQKWQRIISLHDQLLSLGIVAPISDIQHFRLTRAMEEIIDKKIQFQNLSKPLGDYLAVLNKHTKPLYQNRFEQELFDLAKKIFKTKELKKMLLKGKNKKIRKYFGKNWPSFDQNIRIIVDKYNWIYFGHLGPAMSYFDVVKKVKEMVVSKKTLQDFGRRLSILKRLKSLQKKYEKELKLNSEEKQIFKTARDFNGNKACRLEMMFLTYYTLRQALEKLARKYNYSIKDLLCLTHQEFLKILKSREIINNLILKRRYKFCVSHVIRYNKINLYVGNEARNFVKKWVPREEIKKEKIIKGSVASLGKAKGIVKIITSVKDIKKMKRGNILVAAQTTPQLLPAMKKAAAFVTDIGGITSHAAIVARELKVPCVIGTWTATKILKDGDLVEVDATDGLVKKLSKK